MGKIYSKDISKYTDGGVGPPLAARGRPGPGDLVPLGKSAKTPVHDAVQGGMVGIRNLVKSNDNTSAPRDDQGKLGKWPTDKREYDPDHDSRKTPLHYACEYEDVDDALEMVQLLLNTKINPRLNDNPQLYIDYKDALENTALHLAVRRGYVKVVKALLQAGADINIPSSNGDEESEKLIELIYNTVPEVMKEHFDNAVVCNAANVKYTSQMIRSTNFFLDFGCIVGYENSTSVQSDQRKYKPETEMLTYAKGAGEKILDAPLVQLFLHFKWTKFKWLFMVSLFVHTSWSLLVLEFIYSLYVNECPYNITKPEGDLFPDPQPDSMTCSRSSDDCAFIWSVLATIMTLMMMLKEGFELWVDSSFPLTRKLKIAAISKKEFALYYPNCKLYLKQWENVCQLIFIVLFWVCVIPALGASEKEITIATWMYPCAAMTALLACVLILPQLGKFPWCGIYVIMFKKVLKSLSKVILTFCSILVGFAMAFRIMNPKNDSFKSWYLSLGKVVVMMIGELEISSYAESLEKGSHNWEYFVFGYFLHLIFALFVAIALINLLIGLAVSDIEGLRKPSKISEMKNYRDEIYLFEKILAYLTKWKCCKCIESFSLKHLQVATEPNASNERMHLGLNVTLNDIPSGLQEFVKTLALGRLSDIVTNTPTAENSD